MTPESCFTPQANLDAPLNFTRPAPHSCFKPPCFSEALHLEACFILPCFDEAGILEATSVCSIDWTRQTTIYIALVLPVLSQILLHFTL